MPTLERAIKRYSDKHPHMQAYAKCQSRAFMMGTVTFVTSAAVVYVFQELLGSKLPYSRKAILFPPIILGTLAAYTMTRHQTMICQQMWMAIEEKHSVITPISVTFKTLTKFIKIFLICGMATVIHMTLQYPNSFRLSIDRQSCLEMESPYSLNNPVFCNLLFYATVLVLKMLAMSGLTAFYRVKKNVFANPEDVAIQKGVKPVFGDLDVERVRRCHLNDLENITPFLLLGLLYVSTMPNPAMALLHFRIFTIARFIHMVAYVMVVPQPARLLSFIVGLFVTISMAYQVLKVAVF